MDQWTNGPIGHMKSVKWSSYSSIEHQTFQNPLTFKDFMNVNVLLLIHTFRWKISTDLPSHRIPNLHRKSEIQEKKNIQRCLNSKLSAVCFWKCKNITLNSNLEFCVRQMFFSKLKKRHGAWKGMWSFLTKIRPNLTKIGVHLLEYKC